MGSINILSKKNINFVKELIDRNTPYKDIISFTGMDNEELSQVIVHLRSKENYRVFEGQSFFEYSLCNRDEYIKQMNYEDAINKTDGPLKLIICSDMHLCSQKDKPEYIDKIWDTAAKCGINHIINLGDVVEGVEYHYNSNCKNEIRIEPTIESQTLYLQKFLPYDKNIKHHILYGNHDLYTNDGISIDIIKELNERYDRKDIKIIGIEDALLPINNDYIHILHRSYCDYVKSYLKAFENADENQIMFCGHAHISRTISTNGYTLEYIPPLCDLPRGNKEYPFYIGFIILNIEFNNELKMKDVHVQRYRFDESYSKPVCFHNHDIHVRRLKK